VSTVNGSTDRIPTTPAAELPPRCRAEACPPVTHARMVAQVEARTSERLGALAGLIASLAVGVPVALDVFTAGADALSGVPWMWIVAYLGYLVVFVTLSQTPPSVTLPTSPLVGAQAGFGGLAYVLAGGDDWVAVLFVVTAATAAYEWSKRATVVLVGLQTLVVLSAAQFGGSASLRDALLSVLVYGSFQFFAVVVVWTQQREADARASLVDAYARLRATSAMLEVSSRNAERLRIARDLHDVIGHQLTALTLELEVATHTLTDERTHVQRARDLAKQLLTDVREAVGELRTPPRELRDALEAVSTDLPGLHVRLAVADDVRVDDATTLALVRCAQEVVTNTVRHAAARTLDIEVSQDHEGAVILDASDDGRGIESLQPGNGLSGMVERIEAVGGTIDFDTAPGRGMRVTAMVPHR
jgi:signal transduction histidine kinase